MRLWATIIALCVASAVLAYDPIADRGVLGQSAGDVASFKLY